MLNKRLNATTGLILCVAALCVARALFFYLRYSQSPDLIISADSMDYIEPATYLYDTGTYSNRYNPEIRRPPGYPALIAFLFSLFGKGNLLAVIVVQQVLDFLTALIVASFARFIGGPIASFAAAFLFLSDFVIFFYINSVQNEIPFLFLLCVCIALLCRGLRGDGKWSPAFFLGAGLVLTAATYVRPVSLYLFVPLAIGIAALVLRRDGNWRSGIAAAALFVAPWIVLGSLWYVRNVTTLDTFRFVSQENDLFFERTSIMIGGFEGVAKQDVGPYLEKYLGSAQARPIEHIKFYLRHFDTYSKLTLMAFAETLFAPSQWYFSYYFPSYPTDRIAATDYLRSGDFSGFVRDLQNRGLGNLFLLGAVVGHLVLLYLGVGAGLLKLRRLPRESIEFVVLSAIVLAYFLFLVGIWGGGARFRLPMSPFLAVFSGYGYAHLLKSRLAGRSIARNP